MVNNSCKNKKNDVGIKCS